MSLFRILSIGKFVVAVGLAFGAVLPGLAQDCNGNGIPDECDIDCGDPNGPCDLPGCGQSEDCQPNGIPDECDLPSPPLEGLTLWLRAESVVGVGDGEPVDTWQDDSGNGLHVSQANPAQQPLYTSAGLNGLPVLRFEGDDFFQRDGVLGSVLTSTDATTVFFVALQDSADFSNTIMGWGTVTNRFLLHTTHADQLVFQHGDPGAGGQIEWDQPTNWDDAVHVVQFFRDASLAEVSVDGEPLSPGTFTDTPEVAESHALYIGSDMFGNTFTGEVAEVLVYDRALLAEEREAVEAYLNDKYGMRSMQRSADCNDNGVPDECDIADGTSDDYDVDGVPDECDPDCNENGVPDACDIDCGTGNCANHPLGCGANEDCNGNGLPDSCDIAAATSEDCNGNQVPDECDIAGGVSEDCQPDGRPDECQLDQAVITIELFTDNYPGETTWELVDELGSVVASGGPYASGQMLYTAEIPVVFSGCYDFTIFDSYGDGICCEYGQGYYIVYCKNLIVGSGGEFYDSDTVVDIGGCGVNNDCNENALPDECDIADGTSADTNENGFPDECEEVSVTADLVTAASGTLESGEEFITYQLVIEMLKPLDWYACGMSAQLNQAVWYQNAVNDTNPPNPDMFKSVPDSQYTSYYTGPACWPNVPYDGSTVSIATSTETDTLLETDWFDVADTSDGVYVIAQVTVLPGEGMWGGTLDLTVLVARGFDSYHFMWTLPPDCNGNGIPNHCDIDCGDPNGPCDVPGCGQSEDCNGNHIPDECDIAAATCEDCNANGIPDECELADGTSEDCNGNGILDECDIADATSEDCQPNGIPDECDLADCDPNDSTCQDCNGNDVPDGCDLADGTSQDCQPNGIPDECDIVYDCDDVLISGFEGFNEGDEVVFRYPRYSGTTDEHLLETPNIAEVTHAVPAFNGIGAYLVQWEYVDSTPQRWMRLTTHNATHVPNPTIALDRPIRVRLRVDSGRFRLAVGVRETGTSAELGEDGGTAGTIEWVGAASDIDGAPQGVLVEPDPGVWQTFVFDPTTDPIHAFTGDGILYADTNRGTIEHLAFAAVDTEGPFTIYIDDVELLGGPHPYDCNANGVPDECDLRDGTSADCNANGIPDECDIARNVSTDVNEDGIPDECQRDVRVVAIPVTIDPASTTEVRYAEPERATAVTRGATYWIEIWASDLGDNNTGLTGVYVDVSFCEQTSAMALFHGGVFTTFESGTIIAGGVDEFGGSALPSGGGIEPEWVRVGWIEMRADLDAETCAIALAPSSTGVARLYAGLVDWAFVELGAADLTIFAPEITYDLDGDGFVGVGDLAIFAGSWMQVVPPANPDHDFDCDDFVGVGDLSWFATAWLKYVDDPTIQYPPPCGRGASGSVALGRSEDVAFQLVALTTPSASETTTSLPESISAVDVGATYYVEVWVSDVGDINTGLVSAYIDLSYPDAASVVTIDHGSIFDLFTDGDVLPGLIDELGGSDLPGGVGIEPEWARLAMIELTADAATSSATYTLLPSASGVACYGRGMIPWPDIGLDSVSVRHGSQCPGDLDGDGDVDLSDLAQLLAHYGMTEGATYEDGDLDADGDVDLSDLAGLLAVYGTTCP